MTAFLLYMLCLTTGFFCSGGVGIEINDLLPNPSNIVYLRVLGGKYRIVFVSLLIRTLNLIRYACKRVTTEHHLGAV